MRKLALGSILLAFTFALAAQGDSVRLLPVEVNSGYDEWGPVASPDGHALYFTRIGHPQNMGPGDAPDIWVAFRQPGGLLAINAGAPLNSRGDERVVGIHGSGKRIYLYRPDIQALFYSDRQGRVWQPPAPIVIDSFSLRDKGARFTFSPDGSVLLLTFEGKGSMGGRDIYVCFATAENRFSAPRPLGPPANSSADESGLWLAADGETLYFSSDRQEGFGGQDLYCIRRLDGEWDNWTLPRNLGSAINTSGDESFLSMPASGSPAFLLRTGKDGSTNIYEVALPDSLLPRPVVLLTGTVRNAASGAVVDQTGAHIQPLTSNASFSPAVTPVADGNFQLILPYGQDFGLSAEMKQGYFPVSEPLVLSGQEVEELDQDNPLLLASLSRDPAYNQRNEEIIELQLHLRKLDQELIRINEKRKALRQKLTAARTESPDWSPPSDPELDALRHRYQQYQSAAQDTIIPDGYEKAEGSARELESLKERYSRYVQYQNRQRQKAAEDTEDKNYLWEEARSFESLQEEVWVGLKAGLAPKMEQELSASMLEEVKGQVAPTLNEQERRQLELKEEALRRDIRRSFSNTPGQAENWAAKGSTAETEWERQLKAGLRATMEPVVEQELRQELKDDIRAALANDITYWAKKESQVEIQAELNEKLQLQIEQEKRKAASTPPADEAVVPLEPAPAFDAGYREIRRDVLLLPVEAGTVIPLNTIVFEPNKPTLKPIAYPELGRVLEFLRRNEQLVVEIGVHTGGQLSHSNALNLATQRAKAIVSYLAAQGIEEDRAQPRWYGKAFPLVEGNTPEAQHQNQRVEMRIISTGN